MRKLKLWIVASASVLLLNLSSCASSSTTSSVAEPVYTEKVTLSFMASQDWVQDAELDLARQFDEKTGIGVNYQIFPSSQYNNLLMTKLNTGECPDIFAAQSGKFDIKSQYCVEKNAIDCFRDYGARGASRAACRFRQNPRQNNKTQASVCRRC